MDGRGLGFSQPGMEVDGMTDKRSADFDSVRVGQILKRTHERIVLEVVHGLGVWYATKWRMPGERLVWIVRLATEDSWTRWAAKARIIEEGKGG